jgi:hypothetical protein
MRSQPFLNVRIVNLGGHDAFDGKRVFKPTYCFFGPFYTIMRGLIPTSDGRGRLKHELSILKESHLNMIEVCGA